jgi:hypothetical protein
VAFFTYQTYRRTGQTEQTPQAQLDYSNEIDHAYLATPIYHLPMAKDGHLNNIGSYLLGRYFARAYKYVSVDKQKANWINPLSATVNGTELVIRYAVPTLPLALDIDRLAPTEDYGFRVVDETGTIPLTKIMIQNGNEVHLSMTRAPQGNAVIRYAYDYLGVGLVDYSTSASGNLRDSTPEEVKFNGKMYSLFNVAPHNRITITE